MIRVVAFDLDGTLVQTEMLKALSYAQAAAFLRPGEILQEEVVQAYSELVGESRKVVASTLLKRFDLARAAEERMKASGAASPWEAYVQVRLEFYDRLISDAETLRRHEWPSTVAYLHKARELGCRTALATMSSCQQTARILNALNLEHAFAFIAARDDVKHGKPDPEIYLLVAHELGVAPAECLVIEDSPAGVESGLKAGAYVVAVATPFSRSALQRSGLLPAKHIAEHGRELLGVIQHVIENARPDEPDS